MGRLFHDLRHDEHLVALRRRVLQRQLRRQAGSLHIVGPNVDDGKRVRGGLDVGDIHLFQLLDVSEDVADLGGKSRLLAVGQRQPGEIGDVVDLEVGGGGHGTGGKVEL